MTSTNEAEPSGRARARPLLVGLACFAAGFLLFWLSPPFEISPYSACNGLEEGAGYSLDAAPWPPGGRRCTVVTAEGVRYVKTTVPVGEWLSIALIAAAVGVGVRGRMVRDGSALLFAASACLVLLGVVWFFVV